VEAIVLTGIQASGKTFHVGLEADTFFIDSSEVETGEMDR
jgi:hypothetical protein